jgi:hypothetical protein
MRIPLRLVLLALTAAGVAAGEADAIPWSLAPQRVQLVRLQRYAGADQQDQSQKPALSLAFRLEAPDDAPAVLGMVAKLGEPLTDGGERLAITQQMPNGDRRMGNRQFASAQARTKARAKGNQQWQMQQQPQIYLAVEAPTAAAKSVKITGTIELKVGDGEPIVGELHRATKDETLAMTGIPPEQSPHLGAIDQQGVRLVIGDDALDHIASIAFLDGKGTEVQSFAMARNNGESSFHVPGWSDDGIVRITYHEKVRAVSLPVALDVPLPGEAIAPDETVTAVDLP